MFKPGLKIKMVELTLGDAFLLLMDLFYAATCSDYLGV